MTAKQRGAVSEAQAIANEPAARQRSIEAVLSALEEAEVHCMEVTTLRALKQGRPFKIRPTGITKKGFAGFTASDSMGILIGRQLLAAGFPNKVVSRIVASLAAGEWGQWDNILLTVTPDGHLFRWVGATKIGELEESDLISLFSHPNKSCLLNLRLIGDEIIARRRAFLERRPYREPDSIREAREKTRDEIKKHLADPSLKFIGVSE